MRELEKLLQAIEQEVEDGELPRVYLVYVERVREEQATQQNARLTGLHYPACMCRNEEIVTCARCGTVKSAPQVA